MVDAKCLIWRDELLPAGEPEEALKELPRYRFGLPSNLNDVYSV